MNQGWSSIILRLRRLCSCVSKAYQTCVLQFVLHYKSRGISKRYWGKLVRMMQYLHHSRNYVLTLKADYSNVLLWHVYAAFAVHPDFKSHTGIILTAACGAIESYSRKQTLYTRNTREAVIVAADDIAGCMFWRANFLKARGYYFNSTLLQDNQSSIRLETNGEQVLVSSLVI